MKEKVKDALTRIRPKLSTADVQLVDVENGIVKLKLLLPSCAAPMSKSLLHETVEDLLMDELPEIKEIVVV